MPAVFARGPDGIVQAHRIVGDAEVSLARPGWRFILNPGSVGQPRDDDPRASCLLIDTDKGSASWRRVDEAAADYFARIFKVPVN